MQTARASLPELGVRLKQLPQKPLCCCTLATTFTNHSERHRDRVHLRQSAAANPGFFLRIVPSYGLAIVALTVVIRLALFPLSAGSIRSARRMRIAQPVMQKRQAEIKARYASDPKKQQAELGKLMKEFGSPWRAACRSSFKCRFCLRCSQL